MAMYTVLVMAIHPLTCDNAMWDLDAIHHGNRNASFPVTCASLTLMLITMVMFMRYSLGSRASSEQT